MKCLKAREGAPARGRWRSVNGGVACLLAVVALGQTQALADDLQSAREAVSAVQKVVASARLQRVVAELSVPLTYENPRNPLDPANMQDPRNLDVSSVRLGMSPPQVTAALRAAGFAQDIEPSQQYSYETEVRMAWQSNTGQDTGRRLQVEKRARWVKAGQKIYIEYIALPEGPRVDYITYEADAQVISQEAFEAQVLRKYGEQLNGEAEDQRWCTVKAPECEDPRYAEYPALQVSSARRTIWLSGHDPDRKAALEERFKADVAKRGPKQVEPSF